VDLLSNINQGNGLYNSALAWFLSSNIRVSAGFASSRRLLLFGLYQTALNRKRIAFIVTSEDEAVEAVARSRPGLLVLTPRLDQGDGLGLVKQAQALVEDIRTVVVCDQSVDNLVAAGNSSADAVLCEQEFLTETQPVRAMAITLSMGRRYRSPAVKAAMEAAQQAETESWRNAVPPLTARERDLIDLWVQGLGDREAAERLGVSYATIRSYGRTLRQKLGVGSRAQVVLKVLALGLARVTGR
jgi:DNA-binding NarL/FixJ family response regulator